MASPSSSTGEPTTNIDLASDKVEENENESSASTSKPTPSSSDPWPYLSCYFDFKSRMGNSLKFVCKLCQPKSVEISAYKNSPSNLQKHIKVS